MGTADAQTLEWMRQLGTSADDMSFGVSADVLGNVFISGNTSGALGGPTAGSGEAFVTKYDAAGALMWTKRFGGVDYTYSTGVSVDDLGNAYVSGGTLGSLDGANKGSFDAYVTKFDALGTQVWIRQLGTAKSDGVVDVSADGLGNVYFCGYSTGDLGGPNAAAGGAFLAKYDASGVHVWTKQLPTSASASFTGISADRLGNVFLSGQTYGSLGGPNAGFSDAFAVKYDAAGNALWTRQLGTGGEDGYSPIELANQLAAADGLGNLYITGVTSGNLAGPSSGGVDVFVAKLNSAGAFLWTRQLGTSTYDGSMSISADEMGNVIIAGRTSGNLGGTSAGSDDAFVAKYDAVGTLKWTRMFGTSAEERGHGVSADGLGNIYFTGITLGNLGGVNAGNYDAFLGKIIPEPASSALLAAGISTAIARRWRRQWADSDKARR
jgi:hypothetical protein